MKALNRYRSTVTDSQERVEYRYVELRYEGDNIITGTLLRYDDTAVFPWGSKERFEAGCFGDLTSADVILHLQHERSEPIARTGGGGLTVTDTPVALSIRAELDMEDPDAMRAMRKVKNNLLRGLSVEFVPLKSRMESNSDGSYTEVHEQAELRGAGVVDKPQYKKSTLDKREEQDGMNDEQIRKLVEELLAKRELDAEASTSSMTAVIDAAMERFEATLDAKFDAKMKLRDDAEDERAKDKKDDMPPGDDPEEDMMGNMKKKKREDEPDAESTEAQVQEMAEARADLIVRVRSLMPDDFEFKGKSTHDILVVAAGEEVERAEERSDDYLMAKVEDIVERRAKADASNAKINGGNDRGNKQSGGDDFQVDDHRYTGNPNIDMLSLIERKRDKVN